MFLIEMTFFSSKWILNKAMAEKFLNEIKYN